MKIRLLVVEFHGRGLWSCLGSSIEPLRGAVSRNGLSNSPTDVELAMNLVAPGGKTTRCAWASSGGGVWVR
jgi:hypothetical protein